MGHSFMNLRRGLRESIDPPKENSYPVSDPVDPGAANIEEPPLEMAGDLAQAWNFEEFLQSGSGQKAVREYDITLLDDNVDNHFTRMTGDKWDEFVGSIRELGIVTPLIIRAKGDRYEIIAGHNRKYGAIEAGLTKVPCILTDLNDVDAAVWIGVTNNQREKVSDWEWGWTYRTALEAVKRQRDESEETKTATEGHAISGGEKSIDIVAKKFGVNRKTAQRKIRLTYLLPELYECGMSQGVSQEALIDLSYLPEEAQWKVLGALKTELQMTEHLAKQIRTMAENGDVTYEALTSLCEKSEMGPEKTARPKRYSVEDWLFPAQISRKQRQDYVTRALRYVMEQGIDLSEEMPRDEGTPAEGGAHEN